MYEIILRVIFCLFVIGVSFIICYLIDLLHLKYRIISYNKRFNANLDTKFKDIVRLNSQYNDWYLSIFVPYGADKKSQWERFKEWDGE